MTKTNIATIVRYAMVGVVLFAVGYSIFFTEHNVPSTLEESGAVSKISDFNVVKLREEWTEYIHFAGADVAYKEFKTAYSKKDFRIRHLASHLFGEILYQNEGMKSVTLCDFAFNPGCFHGFVSAAIVEEGLGALSDLDAVCHQVVGSEAISCQHGTGHGVYDYMGPKRFMEALEACDRLKPIHPIVNCTLGVFMESSIPTASEEFLQIRPLETENPYAPCPAMPKKYHKSCYYHLGPWWQIVFKSDFTRMGKLCEAVGNMDDRRACFLGIGTSSAASSNYEVVLAIQQCEKMPNKEGKLFCRMSAAEQFYGLLPVRQFAPNICEELDKEDKKRCLERTGPSKVIDFAQSNFKGKSNGAAKEFRVVFSDHGFEPENLTINKGSTVIFETIGDRSFWPASNLHPSHMMYPEFDPQIPVDKNDSWSFKFDKIGTWNYHN